MQKILVNTPEKNKSIVLRVAAYILLSQETSYEAGIAHFNQIIQTTPNYTSAGIYTDYTSMLSASRTNYDRLLKDCRKGRIDRILCRSVSDFAQDEAGFLEVLNFLKSCHVTALFEEEKLDTSDPSALLMLSGLAEFHREEKRSVSASFHEIREKQRAGGVTANRAIYGYRYAEGEDAYDTTEDGYARRRVVIVEEEARVVRRIFRLVAEGKSYSEVARILNEEGVPAPRKRNSGGKAGRMSAGVKAEKSGFGIEQEYASTGIKSDNTGIGRDPGNKSSGIETGSVSDVTKPETERVAVKSVSGSAGWTAQRISQMVRLERYMGDALLHKSYIIPGEPGKRVMNRGELPQEYVEGNHPAIVSRELFEAAQRPRRREYKAKSNADDGRKLEAAQRLQAKASAETMENSWITESAVKEEDVLLREKASARRRIISPPALSGKIICGECGRYYHITNRKTSAIWVCPSARLHNGIDLCSAESVREEKMWEVLKTALGVRFGRSGDGKNSSFGDVREIIKNLIPVLERYRDFEYLEKTDFERGLEEVRGQKKRFEGSIRMMQARLDAQKIRMEILGEEDPEEETIAVLSGQLESLKEESGQLTLKENKILQQMEARKPYWAELEKGAAAREKTLRRLREMSRTEELQNEINDESQPGNPQGEKTDESQAENPQDEMSSEGHMENLRKEVDNEYLSSLIISITIYKDHVAVRWLDDSVTETSLQ